uniref:Uncharacterized protein n=1 Tax=Ascaris lumbricoides TaxID=6252 RepID=A0A0M3HK64_ASCLU
MTCIYPDRIPNSQKSTDIVSCDTFQDRNDNQENDSSSGHRNDKI